MRCAALLVLAACDQGLPSLIEHEPEPEAVREPPVTLDTLLRRLAIEGFLQTAAGFGAAMCAEDVDLFEVSYAMMRYEMDHEVIFGAEPLPLTADDRFRALESTVAILRCLEHHAPGAFLERVPSLFKYWNYDDEHQGSALPHVEHRRHRGQRDHPAPAERSYFLSQDCG